MKSQYSSNKNLNNAQNHILAPRTSTSHQNQSIFYEFYNVLSFSLFFLKTCCRKGMVPWLHEGAGKKSLINSVSFMFSHETERKERKKKRRRSTNDTYKSFMLFNYRKVIHTHIPSNTNTVFCVETSNGVKFEICISFFFFSFAFIFHFFPLLLLLLFLLLS